MYPDRSRLHCSLEKIPVYRDQLKLIEPFGLIELLEWCILGELRDSFRLITTFRVRSGEFRKIQNPKIQNK